MKKQLLLLSAAALLANCTDDSFVNDLDNSSAIQNPTTRVVHYDKVSNVKEVLVKFKDKYSATVEAAVSRTMSAGRASRSDIDNFDSFLNQNDAVSFKRVFPVTKYEKRTRVSGLHLWYKVEFKTSLSSSSLKERLLQIPELSAIEFVSPISLVDGTSSSVTEAPEVQGTTTTLPANDPLLPQQWHYYNDGKVLPKAKPGADINLYKAWERTAGDPSVVVAVIDEYVQYYHPDLKDNMWVNEAEINGKPGVDDDGNGYIDDFHGFDFSSNKVDGTPGGHGTHVAGTIAATNNNGLGVSGIAGGTGKNDGARVMACGALGANGGNAETAALAIKYATDNGAVIAQNSWGYNGPDIPWEDHEIFSVEREALRYFIDNAGKDENGKVVGPMDGGVVIFAAGNDGDVYGSQPSWPSAHPDFIAVSSIGCDYNPAYYTCHGPWVDIIAPGGDQVFDGTKGGVLSTFIGATPTESSYSFLQGTSMACPHVSGVAALVISYAKANNYVLTNTQLKEILLSSGRYIDSYYTGDKNYPGTSEFPPFYLHMADYKGLMGNGLIDASLALDRVDQLIGKPSDHVNPSPVKNVEISSEGPESITLKWKITADYKNEPLQTYSIYFSTDEIQVVDGKVVQSRYVQGPVMVSAAEGAKVGDAMETVIKGLKPNTEYKLAVIGYDQWRSASTPELYTYKTIEVPGCYPVSELATTNVSVNSFTVEWKELGDYYNNPYQTYHVYYSENKDVYSDESRVVVRSKGKVGSKLSVKIKNLKSDVLYYVKVIAYDYDNKVSLPAYIQCQTLGNRLPEITPEFNLPVVLQYWETKSFNFKVADPDYDDWTAELVGKKEGWSISYDKQNVKLTFAGPVSSQGKDKVAFRVVDEKEGESTYELAYQIQENVAPTIEGTVPDMYIEQMNTKQSVDLSNYFKDGNNEMLDYSVKVDGQSVKAAVKEGVLEVQGQKNGLSTLTVTATDKQSKSVETSFKVMVRESATDMDLYPNPVQDVMNIRFGKNVSGPIKVKVLGFNGSPLFEVESTVSPYEPAKINMSNVESGNLWIEVECQGKTYKGNVVKL